MRRSSPAALVALVVAEVLFTMAASRLFASGLLVLIVEATRGLIGQTLLANLFALAVIVGGIIFGLGRLRPPDVGLIKSHLPVALAATAATWLGVQVVLAALGFLGTGTITVYSYWPTRGPTVLLGALIGQLFGNALYEEIAFRGFLFRQLLLRFQARSRDGKRNALIRAMVVSQAVFALMHIPIRLYQGASAVEMAESLLVVFILGCLFALVYVRTGNLLVAIGFHALLDAPTQLFASSLVGPYALTLIVLLAVVLKGPRLTPKPTERAAQFLT